MVAETPKQYGAGNDFNDGIYTEADESYAPSEQTGDDADDAFQ